MTETSALTSAIVRHLPYRPIESQQKLIYALSAFTTSRHWRDVFVLNGYAGTGKTSIIGAYVKALAEHNVNTVVLAPTGRAAKVASHFSGGKSQTIHKRIFRADSQTPDTKFFLAPNPDRDTIFIVDEASLITDNPIEGNSLLAQLIKHIYSAPGCNMILLGDIAQLPPVGQAESAAMNTVRLTELGLNTFSYTLDVPVRQASESGILYNATIVRRRVIMPELQGAPTLKVSGFKDVSVVNSADLADELAASWSKVGPEETLIITRSNQRANKFNQAVRNLVMMADGPIERGDRLVISKNDYYWSKENKLPGFIANGDIAIVEWIGNTEKHYGRFFSDVELLFPADNSRISAKLMLRSLMTDGPSISRKEMERFYTHVLAEQRGEALSEKIKGVINDPFYNALQAKYAYCVTCHKAQGGQWKHVYIDIGAIPRESMGIEFYRWAYTAMTRATEKLILINPTLPVI